MITIHAANETTFSNNGLGVLEPISCILSVAINGAWFVELEHPYDEDLKYGKIQKNNILKITNIPIINEQTSSYQLFRIYDVVQTLTTIKATAFPVAFEATYDAIIEELKIEKKTATLALQDIMTYLTQHGVTKYTVTSDYSQEGVTLRQRKGNWTNTNLIAAISGSDDGSIINHWGGEVAYDNYKIIVNGMLGRKRIAYNEAYYYTTAYWEASRRGQQYANYHFTKANLLPCFFAHEENAIVMMVSLESGGEDWLYSRIQPGGTYSAYTEPIEDTTYGLYTPCIHHFEFNYKGLHWYASKTYLDDNYSISCPEIDFPYHYNDHEHDIDNAKFLLDSANFQEIEDKYEIRYGKNLTGLSVDTDISGTVTRLYPIAEDNERLVTTVDQEEVSYIDSAGHIDDYPYVRAAFIDVPYQLIDNSYEVNKPNTATAIETNTAKTNLTAAIRSVVSQMWAQLTTGSQWNNKFYEPEWVQTVIDDTIATLQKDLTTNIKNPSWKTLIQTCLKDGIGWIKDEEFGDYSWQGSYQAGYRYENNERVIKGQYLYVDKRFCYFNGSGIYEPWKDITSMDWIQPKGSNTRKKYGDNKRYFAKDTYINTWGKSSETASSNDQVNEYWMDSDGWWDGNDYTEASWDWHGSGTQADPYWYGESGATASDTGKFAHDCWMYIYRGTAGLYYFDEKGYLVDELTYDPSWNWHENKGNWYFGSSNKSQNAVYIKNQWLKIDGQWNKFDSDGFQVKMETIKSQFITVLKNALNSGISEPLTTAQNRLYALLYEQMIEYCQDKYEKDGIDLPAISITVNLVELSKMEEYKDFSQFEQIHLGNDVDIYDYVHGFQDLGVHVKERVVGLKYDCIRGYNTEVTIDQLGKTVSQLMSSSSLGNSDGGTRLIAGENVTITNGVINASSSSGDTFAGTQVSVEQTVTSGTELAKIYTDGTPTSIYGVGSDVSISPSLQSGTKVADYSVNGQSGSLYAPTPVSYTPGDNVQISNQNVISATDTKYNDFAGSAHGLVPAVNSQAGKFLKDDGSWAIPSTGASDLDDLTDVTLSTPSNGQILKYNSTSSKWENSNESVGASDLDDLTDVTLSTPSNGQILKYNSTSSKWENSNESVGATDLDDLTDVTLSTPSNGQILKYNSTSSKWENSNESVGATDLDDLTDVTLSTPSNGQILKYNSTSSKWENANESGGTTVIANPSGTATADLEKLQVGNVIYNLPSGSELVTKIIEDGNHFIDLNSGDTTCIWNNNLIVIGSSSSFDENTDKACLIYTQPISKDVKKIRFELYEMYSRAQSAGDMFKFCIGVKATLDTTNIATPNDNDYIAKKLITFTSAGTDIQDELEINASTDYYLYIMANGWGGSMDTLETVQVVGASNLTDMGDVNLTSPSNGQVLSYDSSSQKWINTTPSGGGGNAISYGYDYPSISGQDGDYYIGLDANNEKVAEYLYMVNQWVAINGGFAPYSVLMSNSYRNSTAGSTYVASAPGILICFNQNMNGEASTKTLTAGITTTGTVLYTDTINPSWSSPNRNQCATISIIEVDVGDSVTFSNTQNGNYTTQLHLVLRAMGTVNTLSRIATEAKADNNFSSAQTYTVSTAGKYLAIGFQCRGNGKGTQAATISSSPSGEVTKVYEAGANHSVSVEIIDVPASCAFTFDWINQNDYATKGYCIYKIG